MTTVYLKYGVDVSPWTVPATVSSISVTLVAGGPGGNGGNYYPANQWGGKTTTASPQATQVFSVTPGQQIAFSVGDGGAGGPAENQSGAPYYTNGPAGGTTTFSTLSSSSYTPTPGVNSSNNSGTAGNAGPVTGDGSGTSVAGGGAAGGAAASGYGASGGGGDPHQNGGTGYAYPGGKGAPGIIVITYTVAVTPVASFTYTPASGVAPVNVSFTDTSSNTPTSWLWSFGDGTANSTAQNPNHTFSAAGTFTVSLTATNAAGSSSPVTHTVSVTSVPIAMFSFNPLNIAPIQSTPGSYYPQQIKCLDQSYVSGSIINQWFWSQGDFQTWTASTPPSANLNITNANQYFAVDDIVNLGNSIVSYPTGLGGFPTLYYVVAVTSTYLQISATKRGTAIQYTGNITVTQYVCHASNQQNPIFTFLPAGSPTTSHVALRVGTSSGLQSSNANINYTQQSSTLSKPLAADYYKDLSIFIYTPTVVSGVPSGITTPCATVVNRAWSPNNNLFFTDFQCTGSISKGGTLNFTIVDLGFSTATEKWLATTANMCVAVVLGGNVIWSGQILRSTNNVTQIYSSTSGYAQYAVQCESDVGKMKTQYVKTQNLGAVTGSTGAIVSQLVQPNLTTDINWNSAVVPSMISREGNTISYTITAADIYDQFLTLAKGSGFDWRTRMQTYQANASAIAPGWSSSSTYTFGNSVTPYTTNSFANQWVLFLSTQYNVITFPYTAGGANNGGVQLLPGDQVRQQSGTVFGTVVTVTTTSGTWGAGTAAGTIVIYSGQTWVGSQYFDGLVAGNNCALIGTITSTVSVKNQNGVMSWGYCTSNTTTVLTLSNVQNQGMLNSTGTASAIVLVGPVLDYAWSLMTPQPQLTMLANAASSSTTSQALNFSGNSNYKALATVVIVKGKTVVPSQGTGTGSTITSTLSANNPWDGTYNFFTKSSYVTQRMDGYVYSKGVSDTTVVLIGQGYAWQVGDTFYAWANYAGGSPASQVIGPKTVTAVSTQTQNDGTLTTTLTTGGNIDSNGAWQKYSVVMATKCYIADPAWLTNSYPATIYIGSTCSRQFQTSSTGTSGDPIYGNYCSVTSVGQFSTPATPAFPGTLVYLWNTPQSGSSLKNYGSILQTTTVDTACTQSDLDVYATQALVNAAYYLRTGSVTAKLVMDFATSGARSQYETYTPRMVMEGERICVLTSSSTPPGNNPTAIWPDGQYQNQWQVMSWMLDGQTMQVTCELGDYEKNTYTLMQQLTASTNQTLT